MYISFDYPIYLNFLFVIPFLVLLHIIGIKRKKARALKFANIEAIERISGVEIFSKDFFSLYIYILIFILLTLALSGMVLHTEKKASSFSFVIAIDASHSMDSKDIRPSRLGAAKEAAKTFVDSFQGGSDSKIGIISFSGVSYIEEELSDNKQKLREAIDSISVKFVGGTNILDAIVTSVNMLKDEEAKAVILLSDGQINVNTVEEAINYAKKHDVFIHTIGIGTKEGEFREGFVSRLDENSLKALSYNTGGKYYYIEKKEQFFGSFDDIIKATKRRVEIKLSSSLLIATIILLLLNYVLLKMRYKILP